MEELKIYNEITNNDLFKREMKYLQHGDISIYEHSINVANTCLAVANKLNINVEKESLVKGALLHDYFLYDWHEKEAYHRFHGIVHPKIARDNAIRDFGLNKKEENMILSHMFPLGYIVPKYKESIILCTVDKYCALTEVVTSNKIIKKVIAWV